MATNQNFNRSRAPGKCLDVIIFYQLTSRIHISCVHPLHPPQADICARLIGSRIMPDHFSDNGISQYLHKPQCPTALYGWTGMVE